LAVVALAVLAAAAGPEPQMTETTSRVLVIAHRGASGHRPEHTLEAYRLAIAMGADVIEPDLVCTKDGVLVARHENEIGETTDAAERFPGRKTTRIVDGRTVTGFFVEDFTLAEVKTLRARERLPFRSRDFDGRYEVPTFDEVVELADREGGLRGRAVGVYPETKHPSHFRAIGLPLEPRVLEALARRGLVRAEDPVLIQSFEAQSLRTLRPLTRVRLVQLLDTAPSADDLARIATYADGIGPDKRLVVPLDAASGVLGAPTDLVARAHAAGLFVHAWTMRSDPRFLAREYAGDPAKEYRQFASLGVDGVFTDFPDDAVKALR
jgi:glycerophosphoryl diester phosphodiesterase